LIHKEEYENKDKNNGAIMVLDDDFDITILFKTALGLPCPLNPIF
jgi:hypothetical protein